MSEIIIYSESGEFLLAKIPGQGGGLTCEAVIEQTCKILNDDGTFPGLLPSMLRLHRDDGSVYELRSNVPYGTSVYARSTKGDPLPIRKDLTDLLEERARVRLELEAYEKDLTLLKERTREIRSEIRTCQDNNSKLLFNLEKVRIRRMPVWWYVLIAFAIFKMNFIAFLLVWRGLYMGNPSGPEGMRKWFVQYNWGPSFLALAILLIF